MGHTNSTANIALPQFIGTDKPTWLGDVNGAFSAIDSKIGTIDADVSAVDAKADNAVSDAAAAVATATSANTTAGNASTSATNALNIANNALTVANNADGHTNQLETKVGLLADLHTTDKTSIVNAINELADGSITVSVTAAEVAYNNTVSGLTATDVQGAIDEVKSLIGGGGDPILVKSSSSAGTYAQKIRELVSDFNGLTNAEKARSFIYDGTHLMRYCGNGKYGCIYGGGSTLTAFGLDMSGAEMAYNDLGASYSATVDISALTEATTLSLYK